MTEFDRGRYEALAQLVNLMESKTREICRTAEAMPRAGSLGNLSTIMARERALHHARGWEEATATVSAFVRQVVNNMVSDETGASRE